jgi:hypothetical protein
MGRENRELRWFGDCSGKKGRCDVVKGKKSKEAYLGLR